MRKPYGKQGVEYGYVIAHGNPGYICGTLHSTRSAAIKAYDAIWERPGAFLRDKKKYGTRVAKAELRTVEEWNEIPEAAQ